MRTRIDQLAIWLALMLLSFAMPVLGYARLAIFLFVVSAVGLYLTSALRVVNEYDRLVIFRLGRCIGAKGPGLVFVLPMIDTAIPMDLRERYKEVPHESCITKDNATIDVDFLFYWKVVNPEQAVTKVQKLDEALGQLATGLLRAVIGDISLDEAFSQREHINQVLREKIDEITEHWGVEVTTVEIREIVPPEETREIMTKQMAAERSKRAAVLEAEGYKESAMLRAQGEAEALRLLYEAARTIDVKTMNIKYLETLRHMAEGNATKYIFPLEFTDLVRPIADGFKKVPDAHDESQPLPTVPPGAAEAEEARSLAEGNGHKAIT